MTTYPYRPGSPGPFVMRLVDDAGIPLYEAIAAELRIQTRDACMIAPGELIEGETGPLVDPLYAFDLDALNLPSRPYRTDLFYDAADGEGMRAGLNFVLQIKGGC